MNLFKKSNFKKISVLFQFILNISLIIISLVLVYLLCKETVNLITMVFGNIDYNYKEYLKCILTFFLYFEFIALTIKYFEEDYHFPLRYFMYIGITATVRLIVVEHEEGLETLYFSLSILSLVICYGILKYLSIFSNNKKNE